MEKNKKILFLILITLIIGGGIWYFFKFHLAREKPEEFPYLIDFSEVQNIPETQLERLKQNYQEALEKYKENPNSFSALMTFAFIYYQIGDFEKAKALYIKVGEISPQNYTSFWNLGNTYLRLKDYPGAETAFLKAIENGPDQARHYIALGELYQYRFLEKKDQIPDLYKKGLEELPGNYDLLINLASFYKEAGDKKNALKYYQELIDNYPDMEEAVRAEIADL